MPEENKDFDAIKAERNEINSLLEKGVKFKVGKRAWKLHEPYLGTLDHISALAIKINIDQKTLTDDPLSESKRLVGKSAKIAAKIVAIAVLNNRFKIKFLTGILATYFLWHITPRKLLELALLINTMGNYGDFISSIRLMNSARTTAPNLVEMKTENKRA